MLTTKDFQESFALTLVMHGHDQRSQRLNSLYLSQFAMGVQDQHADQEAVAAVRSWVMAHAKVNGATSAREALSWLRGRPVGDDEWALERTDLEFIWPNAERFGSPEDGW